MAAPTPAFAAPAAADDWVYALAPGDNPWTVSQRFLSDMRLWPKLVAYNHIDNASGLPPGRLLRIPRAWLKLKDASVTLVAPQGDVQVTPRNGAVHGGQPGEQLEGGTVVRTGEQSSVLLRLDDGTALLLRPNSELWLVTVQQRTGSAQTRLELRRGALDNTVSPQGKEGRYEVLTPASVAGVRGTAFRITADDDASRLEVLEGAVAVGNERGQQRLAANTGTRTRIGQAPEPATPLPVPPSLASVPDTLERLPILLTVPAAPGSVGQRTQLVMDDGGAATLASDLTAPAGQIRTLDIEDGRYRMRVRSIDARGLEGAVAERVVRVHARPVPPFVLQPVPDAQRPEPRPRFDWTQVASADRRVRVQIAATPDFASPMADDTVADTGHWTPSIDLAPGLWHWRLQAIDVRRGPGPWGDAQSFQRVLPAPGLPPPDSDGRDAVLRWPAVPGAEGYQLQIASDAAFTTPSVDKTLTTAQWRFETPAPGRYLMRVRATVGGNASPQFGPWSEVQQLNVPEARSHWGALWLLAPLLLAL